MKLASMIGTAGFAACVFCCGGTDGGSGPTADGGTSPDGASSGAVDGGCLDCNPTVTGGVVLEPAFIGVKVTSPVELVAGPKGFYVLEQAGTVKRFTANSADVTVVMTIPTATIVSGSEAGLLGMAIHPKFAENGFVYLYYTSKVAAGAGPFKSVLARFRSPDGGDTLDLASEKMIMEVAQPFSNHNGGKLAFGPDGFLYWGLGDGGSGGDPGDRAQNKDVLLGKILRVDVDGGDPYAIPADNPFAQGGGRAEIFAYGLRNPWKFAFDQEGMFAGDVGQGAYEEVDKIIRGGNYGWRFREGKHCFQPQTNCPTDGLIDPIAEYPRSQGVSITGGYVYRGKAVPALVGKYLYGDYGSGRIWALHPATSTVTLLNEDGTRPRISTFGQGPDGEVYVADYAKGTFYRFAPVP